MPNTQVILLEITNFFTVFLFLAVWFSLHIGLYSELIYLYFPPFFHQIVVVFVL